MEYSYAIVLVNEYTKDIDGYWNWQEHTEVIGVYDDANLAFNAIQEALDELIKKLKERGYAIVSVEDESDGWLRRVFVDANEFCPIDDDEYTIKAIRFHTNALEMIDL